MMQLARDERFSQLFCRIFKLIRIVSAVFSAVLLLLWPFVRGNVEPFVALLGGAISLFSWLITKYCTGNTIETVFYRVVDVVPAPIRPQPAQSNTPIIVIAIVALAFLAFSLIVVAIVSLTLIVSVIHIAGGTMPPSRTGGANVITMSGEDRIRNSGFDDATLNSWVLSGNPDGLQVVSDGNDNALKSAQLATPDQKPNWAGIQQYFTFSGGRDIQCTAEVRYEGTVNPHFKLLWLGEGREEIGEPFQYKDPAATSPTEPIYRTDWRSVEFHHTAPVGTVEVMFVYWHGVTGGDEPEANSPGSIVYLDNVQCRG